MAPNRYGRNDGNKYGKRSEIRKWLALGTTKNHHDSKTSERKFDTKHDFYVV